MIACEMIACEMIAIEAKWSPCGKSHSFWYQDQTTTKRSPRPSAVCKQARRQHYAAAPSPVMTARRMYSKVMSWNAAVRTVCQSLAIMPRNQPLMP